MRNKDVKYISKSVEDCPDDVDLNTIHTSEEKKFIQWTKILQDTAMGLFINFDHYDKFITYYLLKTKVYKKYQVLFSNIITNMCIVIATYSGKLFAPINSLNINKYLSFCRNNAKLLFGEKSIAKLRQLKKTAKALSTIYDLKLRDIRNEIYNHNTDTLLNEERVAFLVEQVSSEDFKFIKMNTKKLLNSIWKLYKGVKLSFTLKNQSDINKFFKDLCKINKQNEVW